MLLYPATVCLIHTLNFGWGETFTMDSVQYLIRTALLGSILNMGTAGIYACLAFLCRDIPKTICVCFAFPVVFSAFYSTVGRRVPAIGRLLDYSTLSQLKYIVGDEIRVTTAVSSVLATGITIVAALLLGVYFFSRAEIK